MRVQHSSTLTVPYFLSYAQLVMKSRELSVEEKKQFIEEFFFKGDPFVYGKAIRQQFLQAMAELHEQ
ncbi:hypothetical protein LZ480_12375 [Solibacillus sp. MA9]|uniref:Uncharacterized protein n=1 Tax=Solibacillus palustris TaxID=2908203 RepID=A0ABS9UEC2_9BACL|nr:hypothetical protein [Solibacillus sp. MA9]MCH7322687.1 hypothetical protein [Solibacillus sp. MA9]